MTEESCFTVDSRPTSPGRGITSSVTRREGSLSLRNRHRNLRPIRGSSPYLPCGGRSHLLSITHTGTRAGATAVCTYADDTTMDESIASLKTAVPAVVTIIMKPRCSRALPWRVGT